MADDIAKIKEIMIDKLGCTEAEITDEKTFADLGADSLDSVELIMEFEKYFDIKIADTEMEGIKSVGEAMTLVLNKIQEK